jgi:hypothetical protein
MLPKQRNQRLCLERLSQIAECSAGPRALGEHVVVRRDEDDRRCGALGLEQISKIESAQPAEVDVEDDALGIAGYIALEKLLGRSKGLDANPIDAKGARERCAKRRIVVDDADPRALRIVCESWAGILSCHANPDSAHEPDDSLAGDDLYWTLG